MPQRIVYLAVMFTLAYWLGNVVGCSSNQIENDNYKLLEEDRPMFETKPNMSDPGAAAPAINDTTASLQGLDRSQWDRISIAPEQGTTPASPNYFNDYPIYNRRVESTEPLANVTNAGWDKTNTLDVLAQPIKFSLDIAALPIRLVTDPPRHTQVRIP